MSYLPYAGIGSRRCPDVTLRQMAAIARSLARRGFILRSGGADGADTAFERAVPPESAEIFLPWRGFNGNASRLVTVPQAAFDLAAELHPAWDRLSPAIKKLMARNCQQILGERLDSPSCLVVCWSPDGCENHAERSALTGGTGQAISLASMRGIPVFNLAKPDALVRLKNLITSFSAIS